MPGIVSYFEKAQRPKRSEARTRRNYSYDAQTGEDDDVIIITTRPGQNLSEPLNESPRPIATPPRTSRRDISQEDVTKTPNVPRIRASFFNRKYRDVSGVHLMPSTPKLVQSNSSPLGSRRNGNQTKQYGKTANKSYHDGSITSDYSTPRTTRTLLTPTSKSGGKLRIGACHLVYKPLELDNESSSESSDSFLRRRDFKSSQDVKTPLKAIEGPPKTKYPKTINVVHRPEVSHKRKRQPDREPEQHVCKLVAVKDVGNKKSKLSEEEVSQCITPPITPEKMKEVEANILLKLPNFIPGSCNIEEVLKIYGSEAKKPEPTVF